MINTESLTSLRAWLPESTAPERSDVRPADSTRLIYRRPIQPLLPPSAGLVTQGLTFTAYKE